MKSFYSYVETDMNNQPLNSDCRKIIVSIKYSFWQKLLMLFRSGLHEIELTVMKTDLVLKRVRIIDNGYYQNGASFVEYKKHFIFSADNGSRPMVINGKMEDNYYIVYRPDLKTIEGFYADFDEAVDTINEIAGPVTPLEKLVNEVRSHVNVDISAGEPQPDLPRFKKLDQEYCRYRNVDIQITKGDIWAPECFTYLNHHSNNVQDIIDIIDAEHGKN